jgi:DHA1 family bicyclomycin/chloramphenicol resistance-like MFS transporter
MKTLRSKSIARVLTILSPSMILRAFAMDIFIPCLPMVALFFNAPLSQAQWVLSIYFVGAGLGQLALGPLSDRFGRRPVILTSIVIVALTSLACSFATSISMLIMLRLLQGIGASGTTVIVVAIVRDLYEDHITPRVYSHASAIIGLAPLLGPFIGGSLLVYTGAWQATFYFVAIYCAVTFIVSYLYISETNPKRSKHQPNNLSLELTAELGGGNANFKEMLKTYQQILQDREFLSYVLCAISGLAGLFLFFNMSSILLIDRLGVSANVYGIYFAMNSLVYMTSNMLSAKLQGKYGVNNIIVVGIKFILVGATIMLLVAQVYGLSIAGLMLPNFITTLGIGLLYGPCIAGAMRKYKAIAGTASAIYGALLYCSGALIVAAIMQLEIVDTKPLAVTMLLFGMLTFGVIKRI